MKVAYATLSASVEALSADKRELTARAAALEGEAKRAQRECRCAAPPVPRFSARDTRQGRAGVLGLAA